MTVGAIVERINRDWIMAPGEQPARFVINDTGGIDADDTSVVTSTLLLATEEEDLLAAATQLEIESELVLMLADPTGTSPNLTLPSIRRGMYGTTATTHADGTEIRIASEDYVPRQAIFDAVADAIEALSPDLWTVGVEETWADIEPIEVPADVLEVLDMRVRSGSRWRRFGSWEELQGFPLSSTGNALQVSGVGMNTEIQVYYKKKPTRPTSEADTLVSLGVETGWVKVIVLAAVAAIIANRDLNQATIDFITQSLEAEAGGPIGSGTDIRNALLQFQDFQTRPLKRQLNLKGFDRVVHDEQY